MIGIKLVRYWCHVTELGDISGFLNGEAGENQTDLVVQDVCIHSATGRSEPDVDNHLANEGPVNTLCWGSQRRRWRRVILTMEAAQYLTVYSTMFDNSKTNNSYNDKHE